MPKSPTARKGTRKAARKPTRKTVRKAAARKKSPVRRSAAKRAPVKTKEVAAPRIRPGVITHTELASADPTATRAWCQSVLGWKFGEPVPTAEGPYLMWRFPNETGGGIRATSPSEVPCSTPYCEVTDIRATFEKALAAGAAAILAPQALPEGMGFIAVVAAPGGVAIGFWSMK